MAGFEQYSHNETFQPELGLEWEVHEEVVDERSEEERENEELNEALGQILDIADEQHLDPYPTHFTITTAEKVNRIGAHGVPGRFLHWTFGRDFDMMDAQHRIGMSRIYELVVNGNPSEAFLIRNNKTIENKFIMAHVLGHTDFFKNNFRFEKTRPDMLDRIVQSAERIESYEDQHGILEVEKFLDATVALEEYVDPYKDKRPDGDQEREIWEKRARQKATTAGQRSLARDEFEDFFADRSERKDFDVKPFSKADMQIPPKPDSDILGFIRNHAKYLEDWQRDIVDIVRGESIYFYPQKRTKIMNEGWAAYWHTRIMSEMSKRGNISGADDEEWIELHAGVVSEGIQRLNPYHLGMMTFEYLEDRYNGNLTERETKWLESQGERVYPHFDGPLEDSPAALKLRQVMSLNDDESIIRDYFDRNLAERMKMYVYEQHEFMGRPVRLVKENGWTEVRDKLVRMLSNDGSPYLEVTNGDYNGTGELYIKHGFDGRPLDVDYIKKTMPYLFKLWQRPIHLETVREQNGKQVRMLYTFGGSSIGTSVLT